MDDYPGNSRRKREEGGEPEKPRQEEPEQPVRQVTSRAVRLKPSFGRKFVQTFFDGNDTPRKIVDKIIFDVILPDVRSMIHEAGSTFLERAIWGDRAPANRRASFFNRPNSNGGNGYVNYNRYNQTQNVVRHSASEAGYTNKPDRVFDLGTILVPERVVAEEILQQLWERIDNYGRATVADFYSACGLSSEPTDHAWGWREIEEFDIIRVRTEGWRISLPKPIPFSKDR